MSSTIRKKVFSALLEKPKTPVEITNETAYQISHISKTLKELEGLGLVECITPNLRKGRIYQLTKTGKQCNEGLRRFSMDIKKMDIQNNVSELITGSNKHIMLVYNNENEKNKTLARFIDEGLQDKQLCIVLSTEYNTTNDRISHLINHWPASENLIHVNSKSNCAQAKKGNLSEFKGCVNKFAEKISDSQVERALTICHCGGWLVRNDGFSEAMFIETRWHNRPFSGTHICPYPDSIIYKDVLPEQSKKILFAMHDIVLDTSGNIIQNNLDNTL